MIQIDQFSLESKYDKEIDMGSNDRFSDVKFLLLLYNTNPSKTAGPDGIQLPYQTSNKSFHFQGKLTTFLWEVDTEWPD